MTNPISKTYWNFPSQFWLVTIGVLFSSSGSSLIWPFQLIYVSDKLATPLSSTATLIGISSFIGIVVSLLGGSIADRFGRKPIMFLAQISHGVAYILMSRAENYLDFLLPMTIMAIALPFNAIGSDAMMADIVPPERLSIAYTILRMANNAGIAIGPSIGGFLISKSYSHAFYGAAIAMVTYSLLILIFFRETITQNPVRAKKQTFIQNIRGYQHVFQDKHFIGFVITVTLGMIGPLMMWTLLAVYTNTNYGLPEDHYAWLPITNALMCVFIQYFVTLFTRKHPPAFMITLGMLIYSLGVGSVALMNNFTGFWVSMVILTFGELILIPTGSVFVANRASGEYRGRYMSVYWLTWGLARAVAPIIGGFLNDAVAPKAVWYGGFTFGIISSIILMILASRKNITRIAKTTSRS